MLNILSVDIDDSGQYACVATNRLGSCTTVGELNIQGNHSFSGFINQLFKYTNKINTAVRVKAIILFQKMLPLVTAMTFVMCTILSRIAVRWFH